MKASKAAALLLLAAGLLFLGAAPAFAQEPAEIAPGDFGFTFYTGLPFIGHKSQHGVPAHREHISEAGHPVSMGAL